MTTISLLAVLAAPRTPHREGSTSDSRDNQRRMLTYSSEYVVPHLLHVFALAKGGATDGRVHASFHFAGKLSAQKLFMFARNCLVCVVVFGLTCLMSQGFGSRILRLPAVLRLQPDC